MRDMRDVRDVRDVRDDRDPRDVRDSRDARDVRDVRDVRDSRDIRDTRDVYAEDMSRSRAFANGAREREAPRIIREMVPTPSLQGGEDVWNDALRDYQKQREVEALEIAELARSHVHGMYQAVDRSHNYQVSWTADMVICIADDRLDKTRSIVMAKRTRTAIVALRTIMARTDLERKRICSLLPVMNPLRRSRRDLSQNERSNPPRLRLSCSIFWRAIPPLP